MRRAASGTVFCDFCADPIPNEVYFCDDLMVCETCYDFLAPCDCIRARVKKLLRWLLGAVFP